MQTRFTFVRAASMNARTRRHRCPIRDSCVARLAPKYTVSVELIGQHDRQNDNNPDWHNAACTTNLASGIPDTDTPASPAVCPIAGTGIDAATPAVDTTNEVQGTPGENNIDGVRSIPAASGTEGKTIGDQLVAARRSWKSYQESLPIAGANLVNNADGFFSNLTDFSAITPTLNPPLTSSDLVNLYAVKHNPFAYFQSVQEGKNPRNSLKNTVAFDGPTGLYADLASGHVPSLSFIVPNQCNDQHGRGNAGAFCNFDPISDGSQGGLNPALIYLGDVTIQRLVTAIHKSPAWREGHNAIVLLWDENDYSTAPNINQVLLTVDTNYGAHGLSSGQFYTHFSLLKSLESGLRLPCLNHACDADVKVMTDLFSGGGDR